MSVRSINLKKEGELRVPEGDVLGLGDQALDAVAKGREGLVDVLGLLQPVTLRAAADVNSRKAKISCPPSLPSLSNQPICCAAEWRRCVGGTTIVCVEEGAGGGKAHLGARPSDALGAREVDEVQLPLVLNGPRSVSFPQVPHMKPSAREIGEAHDGASLTPHTQLTREIGEAQLPKAGGARIVHALSQGMESEALKSPPLSSRSKGGDARIAQALS
jgi:hypothetical protein